MSGPEHPTPIMVPLSGWTPTLSGPTPTAVVTLRNGGPDGQLQREFVHDLNCFAVGARVKECVKYLVTETAGITLQYGNYMGIIQRETKKFAFLVALVDLNVQKLEDLVDHGGRLRNPILLSDDVDKQSGKEFVVTWAETVARIYSTAFWLGPECHKIWWAKVAQRESERAEQAEQDALAQRAQQQQRAQLAEQSALAQRSPHLWDLFAEQGTPPAPPVGVW